MKFFVPDWDDRVDPGYDFLTDRPTLGRVPYVNDVYAHELMGRSLYDGVLVSRMALGEVGKKRETVNRIGMKAYLRLPQGMELLGDCGAYGYVRELEPRFRIEDLIEYYAKLGFDYGVSADHLIVPEFADQRKRRFELTLRNAEEFLMLSNRGNHSFVPVGAIQGWDVSSYVEAARAVVKMGFDYIAIGGLARSNSQTVTGIVSGVRAAIPPKVRVHVFGVGLSVLPLFLELDVTSIDSATPIRQAWLSANDNYYTLNRTYAAIRIPLASEERAKEWTLIGRSEAAFGKLKHAESEALAAIRSYDRGETQLEATLRVVISYDKILASRRYSTNSEHRWDLYRRTLRDRSWKRCPCPICRELGVEVIVFRGNNRNRRRGFHNLWIVRQRLDRLSSALPLAGGLRS